MKQKTKLILDILMFAATLTLFSKCFFGIRYHELAGLVLILLTLTHIILNCRTVKAMTAKFLKVPADIKAGLIVDILLIMCYAFIGISGVMISKTIFTGVSSHNTIFRFGHTFTAALAVILLASISVCIWAESP